MNRFIEWLLGRYAELTHEENKLAEADQILSREFRADAERIGTAQRLRLEQNHVGEGFMLAFQAGQRPDRKRR